MDTYTTSIKCKNCGSTNWLTNIPKKMTIKDYCLEVKQTCQTCECELFIKKEEDDKKDSS